MWREGNHVCIRGGSIIGSNLQRRGTCWSSSLRGCVLGKVETAVARRIAALHMRQLTSLLLILSMFLLPCPFTKYALWTPNVAQYDHVSLLLLHPKLLYSSSCFHWWPCMISHMNRPLWNTRQYLYPPRSTLSFPIFTAWTTPLLYLYGSINHIYLPGAHEEGALFPSKANPLLLLTFPCFFLNLNLSPPPFLSHLSVIYFYKNPPHPHMFLADYKHASLFNLKNRKKNKNLSFYFAFSSSSNFTAYCNWLLLSLFPGN